MKKNLKILILEDSPSDADLMELELIDASIKFSSKVVDTKKDYLKEIEEFKPNLILSDYNLPEFDGLTALKIKKEILPEVPFIMVSGAIGEEFAVEALKKGATDYVLKDNISKLAPAVRRALEEAEEYFRRKKAEQQLKEYQDSLEKQVKKRTKELQTANEELQCTTEELQKANEELQCTTEELRTANEELQIQRNQLLKLNRTLHESEEKFFKAFHSNPGAMTLSDKDEFLDVNESYSKLTGYSKDELIGCSSTELNIISREQRELFLNESLEKGSIQGMEFDMQTKSGDKRIVVSDAESIELDGKIRIIAFNYDITESKRIEENLKKTLKEHNQLNRTLIALRDSSHAMMHAIDEDYYLDEVCRIIIEDCGHSMVWIGFTEEESKKVIPVAYSGFEEDYLRTLNIKWDDTVQGQGPTGTAIRTGKPSICENMLIDHKFKPWREDAIKRGYASSIVFPITHNDQIIGALTIYSAETNPFSKEEIKLLQELADDISFGITALRLRNAHTLAEQALQESLLEVKRSNTELEQFAYVTSHDLREPLRMITSFLQLLEKRYQDKLDSDANEFIGYAVNGAKRLDAMIQDILIYSKVANKERKLTYVNINNVLEQTYLNLKASIDENDAEITYDHLPSLIVDEQLMIQLFQNIISNAIKYRSEESPKINISAKEESKQWLFRVKDNGIGISEKHLDKIFTIFQRLHTKEEYEGTGIGLAIVQKIVHQHGGSIWVESQLGKGSTFYFTLPLN
jgi:PAS domain S-box-containing protein